MARRRTAGSNNDDVLQSTEWPLVRDTIARAAGIETEDVKPESDLLLELQMDSLAVFEVAVDLEAHYELAIPDEEIESLSSAADVVRYIDKRLAEEARRPEA